MGKSVFSRIFVIFAFFALFACDQVFAGGGMFGRGPDGDSGGTSNGGGADDCQGKDNYCCKSGSRFYGQGQYFANNKCNDCPSGFKRSEQNATEQSQCYGLNSDRDRVYYRQITCGAGKYLPAGYGYDGVSGGDNGCISCLDDGKSYCPGMNTAVYPNFDKPQGIYECKSGKVPNPNKTACMNDNGNGSGGGTSGGTLRCGAGQYVPAGLGRCQSCTGTKKYCPGGNYQYPKSVDQGILDCPENAIANTKHDGCYFNLSSTYLKNGPSGAKTKFGNQCWTKTNTVAYAKCLFPNGIDSIANPGLVIDNKVENTALATESVAMD